MEASGEEKRKTNRELNRLLKFLLNDGMNEVLAIEVEKLKGITLENCTVGSKLIVKGPIEVRRGIYMLKSSNVQLVFSHKDEKFKSVGNQSMKEACKNILNPSTL